MARAMGIRHADVQRRFEEGKIVVASVPQDDVRFAFGSAQNLLVVDAGVDDESVLDVRLVLFTFFDRALFRAEVIKRRETLRHLRCKVAIRHRVPHGYDAVTERLEDSRDETRRLALPRTSADGGHRDDWD